MRYLFHIAFRGTNYNGWQRQTSISSIQECIENTLSKVLKEDVFIHGCGRTDTGVHASQYFFHLDTNVELEQNYLYIINKNLPPDISLFEVKQINKNFNAQFKAIDRTYRYFIHRYKDPFLNDISTLHEEKLDLPKIAKAVSLINGSHDFRSFTLTPDRQKNTVCNVLASSLYTYANEQQLCFEITADRFKRGMVRLLVGQLLEIGGGNVDIHEFEMAIKNARPLNSLKSAYPQGLYLSKIRYENIDFKRMGHEPVQIES